MNLESNIYPLKLCKVTTLKDLNYCTIEHIIITNATNITRDIIEASFDRNFKFALIILSKEDISVVNIIKRPVIIVLIKCRNLYS